MRDKGFIEPGAQSIEQVLAVLPGRATVARRHAHRVRAHATGHYVVRELELVEDGPADRLSAGDLDTEEQALVHNFDVSLEQLAWRAYTIKAKCAGKADRFHQEYPATADEAFLSSGRQYFRNLSAVPTTPPRRVGRIDGEPIRGGHLAFKDDPDGPVSIWRARGGIAATRSQAAGSTRLAILGTIVFLGSGIAT